MSEFHSEEPLVDGFERLAARDPAAEAVAGPGRRVTLRQLDLLARAARDRVRPLAPGTFVTFVAPNGPGFLAGLLALRRAGLVAVLADPQATAAETERAGASLRTAGVLWCREGWPEGGAAFSWGDRPEPEPAVGSGIAVVKLTSGSTGEPRGVATPASALIADDAQIRATMEIGPADRILGSVPMSHSYGLSSLAVPALVAGNVVVVPDEDAGPWAALEAAAACGATVLPTVPAFLQALVRLAAPPAWPAALRRVISAGAPLAPETAARFRERFGLDVRVFYGSSETGGITYDRAGGAGERGTVGTPMEGVDVTIDPDTGSVVVRSAAVASGYVPDPSPDLAGGVFRARDAAVRDGGEIRLLGRADWINVKGRKVRPLEVEQVIASIPGVEEVVVVGVPGPGGEGETVRAVVACDPSMVTRAAVLASCRERLTSHKIPRSVVLVREIPRTARGKIDRASLSDLDVGEASAVPRA